MANYLQNNQDYIPSLQPYQPDLNFYSNVLATSQQKYDQGFNKLNSLYSSLLNSSMSRNDNISKRDKYFKTIEEDLKKVSGMDLSMDQNVTNAKKIFDPIVNDPYIIKDISYTKGLQNSFQTSEQFRNCVDPEKCGGEFWQQGVDALQYAQEEFQKASPDESLRYQAPSYVPYQNVTKKAIKAAKDSGFNVSYDHNDGRYIVTDTNGQLLLGQDGKGILPQYLYGLFGNDSAVQKMYSTQAYVQRKNYAKANANKFGGNEDAAESEYLNTILHPLIPKIESSQRNLTSIRDRAGVDKKALEVLAASNGGTISGDGVEDQWGKLQDLLAKTDSSEQYHQQVSDLINTAPHLNDIQSLRNRADNIVANGNFMNTIDAAAYDYAMGTSKRDMKVNPYELAAYNNSLDLSKGIALQNHELGIWNEKLKIKSENDLLKFKGSLGMSQDDIRSMNQYLVDKGVTADKLKQENLPTDVSQWTPEDFKKVRNGGLGQDVAGKLSEVKNLAGTEVIQDPYIENGKTFIKAVSNYTNASGNYLKDSFDNMKQQYLNPIGHTEDDKKAVRDKILNNMTSILEGTGVSPNSILDGTVKTDVFNNQISRFNKSISRATALQEKDVSSQVVTNQWSPDALAKYQVAKQVAEGLYNRRKADNENALNNLKADAFSNMDLSLETTLNPEKLKQQDNDLNKKEFLINSIANPNGLVSIQEAKRKYIQSAHTLYRDDPTRYNGRLGTETLGKTAVQKASEDFDKNYPDLINKYSSLTNNWKSATESPDKGGALSSKNAMEFTVRGEDKFSPAYMQIERIANELPKTDKAIYFPSQTVDISKVANSDFQQDIANKFLEKVRQGDTKGLDFTYKLRNQPEYGTNGNIHPQGAFLDVTLSDESIKKLNSGLSKDDISPLYKTFAIQVPEGSSPTIDQFIQKTTPSETDIYMAQNGNTLNQNLPGLGSYNITRKGNNMVFTGKFKAINPTTQSEIEIEFEPQNLGQVSPEKAIEVGNSLLQQAGAFKVSAKKQLLANPPQNAGPTVTR